ncbi:hypothetical protein AAON49_12235 [Pseudotenacibaculum sp. MALMAid0570]
MKNTTSKQEYRKQYNYRTKPKTYAIQTKHAYIPNLMDKLLNYMNRI